ncbi:MAG: hypothetical protein JXQ84_06650, partial [Rhodospirillaceae bacterium]|nr:hypothetical protein [Rhodospirillaceae bacterium]
MMMRKQTYLPIAACLISLVVSTGAEAHPSGGPGGHDHWRGPGHGPARVLVPDDWGRGHWRHDWHDGRFGWWWVVGGLWYFYPAPIYPHPDPYTPPGAVVAPSSQYAYYCANPAGYYPSVAQCLMPWQMVSLTAPAPVAAPAAPSSPQASSVGVNKTTGGTVLGAVGGAVAGA